MHDHKMMPSMPVEPAIMRPGPEEEGKVGGKPTPRSSGEESFLSMVVRSFFKRDDDYERQKELAERESLLLHKLRGLKISSPPPQRGKQRPDDDDGENVKVIEDLIVKQTQNMTFEERDRAAFDVHGLSTINASNYHCTDCAGEVMMDGGGGGGGADNGPSLVEVNKLVDLDVELRKIKEVDMSNPLVQSLDFRLMFLRCDGLDAKVAAQRIHKHLKLKEELFGPACLHREIQYSDLNPEDIRVLQSGAQWISPVRDSANRFVFVYFPILARALDVPFQSKQRAFFYQLMILARDPHVQRNGFVLLVVASENPFSAAKESWMGFIQYWVKWKRSSEEGVPRKVAAAHLCIDTSTRKNKGTPYQLRLFLAFAQLQPRDDIWKRLRTHIGSRETIEFLLRAYGVTLKREDWPNPNVFHPHPPTLSSYFPPSPSFDNDNNQNNNSTESAEVVGWEASLNSFDALTQPATAAATVTADVITSTMNSTKASACPSSCESSAGLVVNAACNNYNGNGDNNDKNAGGDGIVPNHNDVLFGRGKTTRNHRGNKHAMELVNRYRMEYERAKRFEKTAIAERIVQIITSANGGRFLKYDNKKCGWIQVDSQTARNKISHLYRNTRNRGSGLKQQEGGISG